MFQKILVPFDLSNQSTRAYKVAIDLATKYGSSVTVLTCLEGDAWHHRYYDGRADVELMKKQRKATEKHFEKLEPLGTKKGVSVTSYMMESKSVIKDIVSFAKSRKFDLIVMGSHGKTGLDKMILGSVTNGVSQKSSCPLLIVK